MADLRTDWELVREFAGGKSEAAFQALVQRHVDLVFATALRQLGNAEAAKDVTQHVFVALARKASWLRKEASLTGWLHKAALFESRQWWRGEQRRRRREEAAAELAMTMKADDAQIHALAPILDEGLLELKEPDRQALMLRYFQDRSFREIGTLLGTGEDAARKRVGKALDQLTRYFQRRGYAIPAAGAAAVLQSANQAAPAGLGMAATQAALSSSGLTTLAKLGLIAGKIMAITKSQAIAISLVIAASPAGYQWHAIRQAAANQTRLHAGLTELRRQINREQGELAAVDRKLRRAQDTATNLERAANGSASQAGLAAVAPSVYLWDEQSDYVRLPRSLASRLTFVGFEWKQRGKDQFQREERLALANDGTPSSELLEDLGLTPEEGQRVTEAWRNAFSEFKALAEQFSYLTNEDFSMSANPEWRTVFTPPFPEEGETVRQKLAQTLVETMGEERADLFWQQTEGVYRNSVNDFGRTARAITVARTKSGSLSYGEMYYAPDGSRRLNRAGSSPWVDLPDALKALEQEWSKAAELGKSIESR